MWAFFVEFSAIGTLCWMWCWIAGFLHCHRNRESTAANCGQWISTKNDETLFLVRKKFSAVWEQKKRQKYRSAKYSISMSTTLFCEFYWAQSRGSFETKSTDEQSKTANSQNLPQKSCSRKILGNFLVKKVPGVFSVWKKIPEVSIGSQKIFWTKLSADVVYSWENELKTKKNVDIKAFLFQLNP